MGTDLLPPCWSGSPTGRWVSSNAPLGFPNISANNGTNFIVNSSGAQDTIFTPAFTLTAGTRYIFKYKYQTDGQSGWNALKLFYGAAQNAGSMTTQIGPAIANPVNTTYRQFSTLFVAPTTGTYYFGLDVESNFNPFNIAFDDFSLEVAPACANPPQAGIIAGDNMVCPGSTSNMAISGYSPYTMFQWQVSRDSLTWANLAGAVGDTYADTVSVPRYYRAMVICSDTTYTTGFLVSLLPARLCSYCVAGIGGFCGGNDIDTVVLVGTTLNNANSNCNTTSNGDSYAFYVGGGSNTAVLYRDSTYTLNVSLSGTSITSCWIDFNQNGLFDANEWVQVTTAANSGSASISVPYNAVLGQTIMRVRSRAQGNPNYASYGCSNFGSGETNDFIVTITTDCSHPPVVTDSIVIPLCHGGANGQIIQTRTSGDTIYANHWSNNDSTLNLAHIGAGSYTDTITFHYSCKSITSSYVVTEPTAISTTIDSSFAVKCNGGQTGSIYLSTSGGTQPYTNHWSSGETTFFIVGKGVGIYRDTITDNNGCKLIFGPDTITQPSALTVASDSTHNIVCFGQNNGAAYVTAHGGVGPYIYLWSTNTAGRVLQNVSAGNYTISVTDNNGCTVSISDSVSQPRSLQIITDSIINVKCYGAHSGAINLHVTGGTFPYSYLWNGGASTFYLFNQAAGVYTLTVTDNHGCVSSISDTITSPVALVVSSNVHNPTSAGGTGSIGTTVSGGVRPYVYHWSNSSTTDSISNLPAGVYTLTVTDANGCASIIRDTIVAYHNSISEVGDMGNISIFPNPSTGLFNISIEMDQTQPVHIDMSTMTGQAVPATIIHNAQTNTYSADLSSQAEGVYLLKITSGVNTVVRRIILVR